MLATRNVRTEPMRLLHRCDPGHGWVQIDHDTLRRLGIAADISSYSYRDADFAYLEEDCDAGVLLDALRASGIAFDIVTTEDGEFIRQLRQYRTGSHVVGR